MPSQEHLHPPRTVPLLAALTAALLAGCGSPGAPAAAPASTPATAAPSPTESQPADAVKAALHRLTTSTYSYAVTGDYWDSQKYRASGAHDPKARKHSRTYVISGGRNAMTRKVIVIGDDSYENTDGASRWQHADLTRLKPSSDYRRADPKDPGGLTRFTAAIHSTRRLGPHTFEGDVRVEITPGVPTFLPLGAPIFGINRGTWASYTLTTDANGDVAWIKVVFDTGQGVLGSTTTFSKLGKPVQIIKPSRVTELRRSLYDK